MPRVEIKLPAVPSELKVISPFISRAQELSGKEPVIAYYCLYQATQTGISAKAKEKDAKSFLMSLMNTLESMKEQLKDRKEISSDEAAARYIENFALKVFANADNEDRKGGSNRSTAKKFLAASNFFELLPIFDAKHLNPDIHPAEKIKYAKWKAADIAKAYREGRVPLAGPAGTTDGSEDELAELQASSHSEIEDTSAGSSAGGPHLLKISTTSSNGSDTLVPHLSSPPIPMTDSIHLKPALSTIESSSSTRTLTQETQTKSSAPAPTPLSTNSVTTSSYVVDLSSPATTAGPRTPLKSPGVSDGMWSTAATPGIEPLSMFPGLSNGSGGRANLNFLNPASIAMLNSGLSGSKGDSPLSPGPSPKPRSGLGTSVVTAGVSDSKPSDDTDEEDGQWSTAGNDPFSRQNSMMPPTKPGPSFTLTPSLGALKEEVSPQSTPQKSTKADASNPLGNHSAVPANALAAPLPQSAANTAPSSPSPRPDSVTYAASLPLPPVLPPPTQAPSSSKSDTHALPTEQSPNKGYKFTSSIVGDSTSDGDAPQHQRRRANSVTLAPQSGNNGDLNPIRKGSSHIRASSVTTAPNPIASTQVVDQGSVDERRSSLAASADEEWERASLERLARLPDGASDGDEDSLAERIRNLSSPDSSSETPAGPQRGTEHTNADWKSRRNTIKASAPPDSRLSGSDFGFHLPGVPSAPPSGAWGNGKGSGSDSGGEGDFMAKLPSAPAIPPLVQDQLPHVTVHMASTPREELHVNPHFPTVSSNASTTPTHPEESPSTPRSRTHSRTPSVPTASSNQGYESAPHSAMSPPNHGNSIQRGFTPPNSVTSPYSHFNDVQHNGFAVPPPPPSLHQPTHIAPQFSSALPSNVAYGAYGVPTVAHDEFGLPAPARTPPTELDPETIGKVQRHTKFALSALNFEDIETAREELKKALRMLS